MTKLIDFVEGLYYHAKGRLYSYSGSCCVTEKGRFTIRRILQVRYFTRVSAFHRAVEGRQRDQKEFNCENSSMGVCHDCLVLVSILRLCR